MEGRLDTITGGFMTHLTPLIRTKGHAHTGDLKRPLSDLDIQVVNTIQTTPWRINTWVLDVMSEAWTSGQRLGGLEVGEPTSLMGAVPGSVKGRLEAADRAALQGGGRLPDGVWEAMPKEDRDDYLKRRAEIHAANASIEGRSRAILDAIGVSQELRERPAIWFPYAKDFRGRIYPMGTFGPQPQGSDIQKALIHFAEGKALGDGGLYWLLIRAANTFGQDKLSMEGRVEWALDHKQQITEAALDPLGSSWWTQADEPWSFLATCHELNLCWLNRTTSSFLSHLPIPLDGSCNGLQHLAAMGLDPIGALATNLTATSDRQDVYQEVANRVAEQVEKDVLAGVDEARLWHGKVSRKTVKRAVMTTPLTS